MTNLLQSALSSNEKHYFRGMKMFLLFGKVRLNVFQNNFMSCIRSKVLLILCLKYHPICNASFCFLRDMILGTVEVRYMKVWYLELLPVSNNGTVYLEIFTEVLCSAMHTSN